MERNRYAVCVRTPRDSGTLFARFHKTGGTHGAASREAIKERRLEEVGKEACSKVEILGQHCDTKRYT